MVIHTDASEDGWGAYSPATGERAGSRWLPQEARQHINCLELKAVLLALQAFCKDRSKLKVHIRTDNTTTMYCIRNQGSTRLLECNDLARQIWWWAKERDIWLSTAHIPGIENTEGDQASRVFNDAIEWSINNDTFDAICKVFGQPEVDLFASRLNKKVSRFYSWLPDPESVGVDVFPSVCVDRHGLAEGCAG
jgi:ribonuclease HI